MNKRELMYGLLNDHFTLPYVPAAFFLHFPTEYHQGQAAVDKHLEFFRYTGMDLVKIQFESRFPPRPDLKTPGDWKKMPEYGLDFYEGQLSAIKGIVEAVKEEAVIVVTLYSTFMCAAHSIGLMKLTEQLEAEPEKVRPGLETITDSLLNFVRECARLGVDGFYTSTQGGEAGRFKVPRVFENYIKPFDLKLMNEINRLCSFNILHVCDYWGTYEDITPFLEYPGQIVSSPLAVGGKSFSPREMSDFFQRPFMGGLERTGTISTGSPEEIRKAVRDIIAQAPPRFILGADCTVPNETPWKNLKAAIDAAHETYR
ncbi:MAG: uroporphyrinogen decarboxylase family protein [Thermodesulfobacteriota bacterium]